MVKLNTQKNSFICGTACAALMFALFMAKISHADTRQDAIAAVSDPRMADLGKKMPDEMENLKATFAKAEQYHEANDTINSEQYYRLTIQKARLLTSEAANHPVLQNSQTQENSSKIDFAESESSSKLLVPATTAVTPESAVTNKDAVQSPESASFKIASEKLVGAASFYTIIKGDTLRLIAAKLGVSRQHLMRMNKLDEKASLQIGQKLKFNNRKIIPLRMQEGIVVNIPDRTLYYFQQGKLVRSLPVALGTATKNEKYVWQTPTGKFKITAKQKDPTWHVPPSIQAEMEDEGKEVIESVPPGPDNPLGKYAIKTSIPGILIHSTTKPWSIYSFASHGCIRVYPSQMEEFFKEVKLNTPGEIIYRPVKLAVTEDGRIFLEVHQDVYSKSGVLIEEARKMIEQQKLSERVDWKRVKTIVRQKSGTAEEINL